MINKKFLEALYPNGVLSPVIDLVKRKRLILAFRSNCINVYHNGHSIYRIFQQEKKNRYKIEFDFNHARYTETWQEELNQLKGLGFMLLNNRETVETVEFDYYKTLESGQRKARSGNNIIYTYIPYDCGINDQFWQDSSNIFIKLVDDFF